MTLILTFIVAMTITSACLSAACHLFLCLNRRAAHWSALWAVALTLSVLVPILGLAARLLPDFGMLSQTDLFAHALPSLPLDLSSVEVIGQAESFGANGSGLIIQAAIWLYVLGAMLRGVIIGIGRWQLGRIVRAATPDGRADGVEVLLSASVQSAFAWTPLGRPGQSRIVIPTLYAREMSKRQLADIIRHERQHIARRDDEAGLILRALICLCWVSPFAHSLFARWAQAIELQCDMAVTDGLEPRMRRAYAETLLMALHIMAGRVRQYPAASFSTHRLRNEKMRIAHIVNGTRPSFKRGRDRILLTALASGIAATGTFGIAATAQADMPDAKIANSVTSSIVSGRLTAKFGQSFDPFKQGKVRKHWGVDIAAPLGTPIYAPAAGTVEIATDLYNGKPAYGTVVVLHTDDGVRTLFSHLDGYTVEAGQRVLKGQQIATVGSSGKSTGPHVHIETYRGETRVDPATVWNLSESN